MSDFNNRPVRDVISKHTANTAPETPRLARVIGYLDPEFMGGLEVQILKEIGNSTFEGQIFNVRMMTPFGGQTSSNYLTKNDDYNGTQKSYGMWFVPPDIGTQVIVIFINGNASRGYWIGCVPDDYMNFMVPGIAATQYVSGGNNTTRLPVAEYNRAINSLTSNASKNPTTINKPQHPFTQVLTNQGLVNDDIRGITSSSARREVPSAVFGLSTPGPVDKTPGYPTGVFGKQGKGGQVQNLPVSRLGGSTFTLDDGNDKFLRKAPAGGPDAGPPDYASLQGNETTGNPAIPHNECVRIRTRTGHQILLHNSEDLIYIGNGKGTAWIELTSNGKIDIYAADSISVHTQQDINFHADRDINLEAGRNVNIKSAGSTGRVQVESVNNLNVVVGGNYAVGVTGDYTNVLKDFNVTTSAAINLTSANTNLNSSSSILLTATLIGENGPVATPATGTAPTSLSTFKNYYNGTQSITSIMKRIPNVEPWAQHENLDPQSLLSTLTDREVSTPITFISSNGGLVPKFYNSYTTATDAFNFIRPASQSQK
jgi:phage baseplate assembly protein gpV